MEARYLRVKNHADKQHYDPLKRRPPWIKLFNNILGGESGGFDLLSEQDQWQLVRIWLVASKSSAVTRDEKGRVVPVVSDDEKALRRSIMSLKRIPLEKFIRDGWLIPVSADELLGPDFRPPDASATDSEGASAEASALLVAERQRFRGSEKHLKAVTADQEIEGEIDKLMTQIKDPDEGTRGVLVSLAKCLPLASVAKVRESCQSRTVGAGYAVNALKSEIAELGDAA